MNNVCHGTDGMVIVHHDWDALLNTNLLSIRKGNCFTCKMNRLHEIIRGAVSSIETSNEDQHAKKPGKEVPG